MRKYFLLQLKRQFRTLPLVLAVVALLSGALGLIFRGILGMIETSSENTRLKIAVSGTDGDPILEAGVSALAGIDSSRFYFEIYTMEEAQAMEGLKSGALSACIVIPPDFLQKAMHGTIIPLKYVSAGSPVGLNAVVKEEITRVISDMVLAAQKGIYGTWDAMNSRDLRKEITASVNGISLALTEYAFDRDGTYTLTQLGISDGLRFSEYLFCGMTVLFLLLCTLPFSLNLVEKDDALHAVLISRGTGTLRQLLCQYSAYALTYGGLVYILLGIGFLATDIRTDRILAAAAGVIPVILVITSMSYLFFSLSRHIVAALVGMLSGTLILCFLGGCLYPAYFFPESIQILGAFLPTSLCREQIAACLTGFSGRTWILLCLTGIFLGLAWLHAGLRRCAESR